MVHGELGRKPWHKVITEARLTKKFTTDEEGTVLLLPRMLVEKSLEVERRRFYVLSADIEAEVVRDTRWLHRLEK